VSRYTEAKAKLRAFEDELAEIRDRPNSSPEMVKDLLASKSIEDLIDLFTIARYEVTTMEKIADACYTTIMANCVGDPAYSRKALEVLAADKPSTASIIDKIVRASNAQEN
jgi:hypothetical protein